VLINYYYYCYFLCYVGPCHHSMASPRVAYGDNLHMWRVTANVLNKQWRTADKERSSSLEDGTEAK